MIRCSRRTRAKFFTKISVQKNYSRDVLLGRLVRNKQKNFSKVCFLLIDHVLSTNSTFRSRVVKFALAGSEYSLGQNWIPLILPSTCVCLPTFSTHPWPSSLTLGSFSLLLALPTLFALSRSKFHHSHLMSPASMLTQYLLVFRRLALTLLTSRCWKPLTNNCRITNGIRSLMHDVLPRTR
jgi:hypothetical protein